MRPLIAALMLVLSAATQAQPYPNRPVKFVVPFPPGGNLDFVARTVQPKLAEFLGQPVVVENKGGAAGIVGAEYAARQPADGYTIFLGNTGTIGLNPSTYTKLPYDPLKDFAAVGQTTSNALLAVVHPAVPVNSLQEFIAYAKANPGKVNCGVAGSGSLLHFASEMLKGQAGIDMQLVFYKGSGPLVTDLLGGQVQILLDAPPVSMSYVKAGRLKAIAVTGAKRLAALPDVPTFDEAGLKGFDASGWQGVLVPAGTPASAVATLSDALLKALAQPEVRERFATQGLDAAPSTPEQFGVHIRAEIEKWARIAKSANIKAE
jgi:tripartite-type tricarboxylate transporter receptor subunit TctC